MSEASALDVLREGIVKICRNWRMADLVGGFDYVHDVISNFKKFFVALVNKSHGIHFGIEKFD